MKPKNALLALLGSICLVSVAQAEEPSWVDKTKSAIHRGATATAHGIERGVKATGHGIEVGLSAAGRGINRGAEATSNALHKVGDKLRGSNA